MGDLRHRDLGLGPENHLLGNPDRLTPNRVVRPLLRQEQVAVQKTLEIAHHITQVDPDHTVVRLARVAAPLPLDPSGVRALLGVAALVDDPEGLGMGVVSRHDPLDPVPQVCLIPEQVGEEPLQGPRGDARSQRNRLDALTLQIRQLALDISPQVLPRLAPSKTVIEFPQVLFQLPTDPLDLLNIHVDPPCKLMVHKELSVANPRPLEPIKRGGSR
jgi:hypothetical protein